MGVDRFVSTFGAHVAREQIGQLILLHGSIQVATLPLSRLSLYNMSLPFGSVLAPPLLLISISMLLTGIMMAQVFYYWSHYPQDHTWIRLVVYVVCFIEIVQAGFSLHVQYYYIVDAFESLLPRVSWSISVFLIFEMFTVALVQGFYICRIWQLGRCRFTTSLLGILLFCRCAFGIATAALTRVYKIISVFENTPAVEITVNVGLCLAVVVDFLTTAAFIYFLKKKQTHVTQTKHIIHKLMFYTINTGAITIIFSTLTVLTFNFCDSNLIFAGFFIMVGKVYANAMLALLNARQKIKNTASGGLHAIPMNDVGWCGQQNHHVRGHSSHGLTIEIAKHIDVITDRSQPNSDPSADKLPEDTLEEMKGPCYSLI